MECRRSTDGYSVLAVGRKPYAVVALRGSPGCSVDGTVSFYDTPIGVLVWAELAGEALEEQGVYGFCFGLERCRLCMHLPLIYGKDGCGRGRTVTEGLRGVPLVGREIYLKSRSESGFCTAKTLAVGRIVGA